MRVFIFFVLLVSFAFAGAKHKRDGSNLPPKEKAFAEQLSLRQRKIFCGQFNEEQRHIAMQYAKGRGRDECATPDEAVRRVMEETGMSLTERGRHEE